MNDLKGSGDSFPIPQISPIETETCKELRRKKSIRVSILRILGVIVVLGVLAILVRSFLPDNLSIHGLLEVLDDLANGEDTFWLFLGLFVVTTQAFVSLILMIVVTALILGTKTGIAVNLIGVMVSALIGYFWGWLIGPKSLKQLLPKRVSQYTNRVSKVDLWSIAFFRLVPVIPYQVFNLVAGAIGIPLRGYILGTMLADFPTTLLLTWSVGNLRIVSWQGGIPWSTILLAISIPGLLTLSGYLFSRKMK
jgi:uncharacterized membrane protein YdjX (TVP38/TMEM64 family)